MKTMYQITEKTKNKVSNIIANVNALHHLISVDFSHINTDTLDPSEALLLNISRVNEFIWDENENPEIFSQEDWDNNLDPEDLQHALVFGLIEKIPTDPADLLEEKIREAFEGINGISIEPIVEKVLEKSDKEEIPKYIEDYIKLGKDINITRRHILTIIEIIS